MRGRRLSRLVRTVLAIVSACAAVAAIEGMLRAAGYRYSPVRIGSNVNSDWREQHAFHDRHLVYDPDLIWRPFSGQFSPFNPQGFRGLPVDPIKPSGALRVIALGDSNTFGWDVDEGVNWPTRLQGLLRESHPGAEVINAGVWGYSSFQGVRRFKELVELDPDLVLVSFGANDAQPVRVPDARYVRSHDRIERLTRATRRLRLAQLAVAAWDRLGQAVSGSATLGPRVPVEDYVANLREIVDLGRSRGITVVLLTRPYVGSSTDPASWKTYAPSYNAAVVAVGRAMNAAVIDVYGAFRNHDNYFDDESHFGVEGHRVAAELIQAELATLIGKP